MMKFLQRDMTIPMWFYIIIGSMWVASSVSNTLSAIALDHCLGDTTGDHPPKSETPSVMECRCSSESDLEESYAEGFEDGVDSMRDPQDPRRGAMKLVKEKQFHAPHELEKRQGEQ